MSSDLHPALLDEATPGDSRRLGRALAGCCLLALRAKTACKSVESIGVLHACCTYRSENKRINPASLLTSLREHRDVLSTRCGTRHLAQGLPGSPAVAGCRFGDRHGSQAEGVPWSGILGNSDHEKNRVVPMLATGDRCRFGTSTASPRLASCQSA